MYNPPHYILERFARKFTILDNGCWQFNTVNKSDGYTQFHYILTHRAYRWLYQVVNNIRLTRKQELDHLCRNRGCVNPKHLEVVDKRTNILRGDGFAGLNARKVFCKRGHEFRADNISYNVLGGRVCRVCERARLRARRILSKEEHDD